MQLTNDNKRYKEYNITIEMLFRNQRPTHVLETPTFYALDCYITLHLRKYRKLDKTTRQTYARRVSKFLH